MTELAVFCSDKIDFRSRQMQTCPTTADKTTTPYPHPTPISENSSANGCSRSFELFSFFSRFQQKKFFFWGGGGGHVPRPTRLVRLCPLASLAATCVCVCVCVCLLQGATVPAVSYLLGRWSPPDERSLLFSIANTGRSSWPRLNFLTLKHLLVRRGVQWSPKVFPSTAGPAWT